MTAEAAAAAVMTLETSRLFDDRFIVSYQETISLKGVTYRT